MNVRSQFPIFKTQQELVYLDSAATTLKPQSVLDKINEYYLWYTANIHRGIYHIAERATYEYEETRKIVARFINAYSPEEVIFTKGTTEAINLVASTLGHMVVGKEDNVCVTIMDHHSNFVPWQQCVQERDATFHIVSVDSESNALVMYENDSIPSDIVSEWVAQGSLEKMITPHTKIFALPLVSNTLGVINPVKKIIAKVKHINPDMVVIVDAAQAMAHIPVDVQELGCDFLAFSGHKMFGPTGVGVLWGRKELLERMRPYQFGGEMIQDVYTDHTIFKPLPHRFEAGTPPIAQVGALKEAITFIQTLGFDEISQHEHDLATYGYDRLKEVFGSGIRILCSRDAGGIIAFALGDTHPHDIAQILDENNISVRAGNHCTQPLHAFLGLRATTRMSMSVYNTRKDIDAMVGGLQKVRGIFHA